MGSLAGCGLEAGPRGPSADCVGRTVPTASSEDVQVRLKESDGAEGVWLAREEA